MAQFDRPVHACPVVRRRRRPPVGDQPQNLALSLAAGLSIAQAGLSTGQEAAAIVIYVLLGGATILGPLVVYLAMGRRAVEILGGWRTWLADNNAAVMSVLLLVFAVVLIGKGISGLSG